MNKEYSSVLVLCLALIILYLGSNNIILLYVSLGIGLACLLFPWLAQKTHWLWMKISTTLGTVSSVIILAVIFFVIVTPLSFIARLAGKKFIVLKRKEGSYFEQRTFLYTKESLEDVW